MKKILLIGLLFLSPVLCRAADLAGVLPTDTTVYMHLDVEQAFKDVQKLLPFIDQERGKNIIFQVGELYAALKEYSTKHEFTPKFMDQPAACQIYFLVMAKDKPEVIEHTYKSPKWDPKTGKQVPGEMVEQKYTTQKEFTLCLVVETTEENAADFVQQFKGAVVREREKKGEEGPAWEEVEVEKGELIRKPQAPNEPMVGRLGKYVVFADSNPKELWAAIMAPGEATLSQTPLYQRYKQEKSTLMILTNLSSLIAKGEQSLREAIKQAQERAEKTAGTEQERWAQMSVQGSTSSLSQYLLVKQILSLDKIRSAGVTGGWEINDQSLHSRSLMTLSFSEPVSAAADMLLNGGKPLMAPDVGNDEAVALMARLGAKEIFSEVVKAFSPQQVDGMNSAFAQLKEAYSVDLKQLINMLSGDIYSFIDVEKREYDSKEWDPQTNSMVTKKKVGPLPRLMFLVGLDDAEATAHMLSEIFTRISAAPGLGNLVATRSYQETPIYLVGMGVDQEGAEPDGLYSYAAVVLGRHLSFGSWKDMTDLIRRAKAEKALGENVLGKTIANNPKANFLMIFAKSFNQKVQDMLKEDGKDPMEKLLENITGETFKIEDEALAERVSTAVKKLIENYIPLVKKVQTMGNPYGVATGRREGGFYEIGIEDRMTK